MKRRGRNSNKLSAKTGFLHEICSMNSVVLLDTGVLGMVAHPQASPGIANWLTGLLQNGTQVLVPEIADYELRRELLHQGLSESIQRLDALKSIGYVPIDTETMLKAAEFWSEARKRGRPTADDKALDGDMILSAQAAVMSNDGDKVVIATDNVGHLALFATAQKWHDIS